MYRAAQIRRAKWTFLGVGGMLPTNNVAERCLRRAVIWDKKCFGTDSESGSHFVERILSAVVSPALQGRDAFALPALAREAGDQDTTPSSLGPTT